jgi:5-methyltetrahydrofolate--homocysteine methyltransferase
LTTDHVIKRFRDGGVLFDGALGTMLIAKGLKPGRPPEEWNRGHPSVVREIYSSYLEAGSEVISTNTFGGNRSRLRAYGLEAAADELNTVGVTLAQEAVSEFASKASGHDFASETTLRSSSDKRASIRPRLIAVSLGPTGRFLPPVGDAAEQEIEDEVAAQIQGIKAKFDLIVIETMYDLREALAALAAAKRSATVPVAVQLTFNKNPRGFFTIMGDEAIRAAKKLEDAGADVVGANCSIESAEMIELGRVLRGSTELPILCQPNAGKPRLENGAAVYDQAPTAFAQDALTLFDMGVNAVGGCCGTTPDFIREVSTGWSKR